MIQVLVDLFNGKADFFDVITRALSLLILIFAVLPMHNFAQSKAAEKMGDRTSKHQGMQTLNPFAHIDYAGALTMILFGIGWGRPTYINQRNFKNPKKGIAFVAAAGILANILYAFVLLLAGNLLLVIFTKLLGYNSVIMFIYSMLDLAAWVSVSITMFYLLPIPPLDGAKILAAVLPDKYYYKYLSYERYFSLALIIIIVTNVLDTPLYIATSSLYNGLSYIASLPLLFL